MRSAFDHTENHQSSARSDSQTPCRKGVLLVSLGTPDEPTVPAVRRYLAEFLSDPAVIRLPKGLGFLNKPLGHLIAYSRARRSSALYRRIWNEDGSPLRAIADAQVRCLQEAMPRGWRVFGAMRYGEPAIHRALRRLEQMGIEELVVVPMYPHYSGPTTYTALKEVYDCLREPGHVMHVTTRPCWYSDHGYILAQTRLIEEYAHAHGLTPENTFLLFSTHGLPISYVQQGDPYPDQVACSAALVGERLGWPHDRMSLAFQSRFGPTAWLKPFTDETLADLVRSGEKRVLVCPISFTADCLETLEELDLRYREIVEQAGAELYLAPALNTYSPFIKALKDIVLRGQRPMRKPSNPSRPFFHAPPSKLNKDPAAAVDSLIMVGLALPGRVQLEAESSLKAAKPADLKAVKRSACELPAVLRRAVEEASLREGLLWNTCHRFEFFGIVEATADAVKHEKALASIGRVLFEDRGLDESCVNVLIGRAAWEHLVQTAVGLNSALPGERDVLDQLLGATRLADRAGTIGPVLRSLIEETTKLEESICHETAWGRFEPAYTQVALSRVVESAGLDLGACRITVVGGSTTSASVLTTLTDDFEVPSRQLTLVYRGHKRGGHLKVLRRAVGNGKRIRVQSYGEASVMRAVAAADVVIFGVDRKEPILTAEQVGELTRRRERPLTLVDFNTFGSTTGLERVKSVRVFAPDWLDQQVSAYADRLCASETFQAAAGQAQTWISRQLHSMDRHDGARDTAMESALQPTSRKAPPCGEYDGRGSECGGRKEPIRCANGGGISP